MEVTQAVGGSVELVILFTVITGIVGGLLANTVLLVLKLDSKFAQGASLGSAAHGFGTSTAFERHKEEGARGLPQYGFSAVFLMVLFGPSLIHAVVLSSWLILLNKGSHATLLKILVGLYVFKAKVQHQPRHQRQ